ncbi:MAG: hypothetical protein ACOYZ7_10480 [Chloroflexota bacterium]
MNSHQRALAVLSHRLPDRPPRDVGDAAALEAVCGRELTFWGGIDTQRVLPHGSPQEVGREVWRRLDDLAADGGYVLAGVPPQNVCAMFQAADEWPAGRRDDRGS